MSHTTHDSTSTSTPAATTPAATSSASTTSSSAGSVKLTLLDTASLLAFNNYSEEVKVLPFTCTTLYKRDDDLLIGLKKVRYGPQYRTRLMSLCRKGDMHGVQVLLRVHADVNAVDGRGRTALHYLCDEGINFALPMIDLLVGAGADVHARDGWHATPLLLAAHRGHESVCLRLIERGADVNAKDKDGTTPLMEAVLMGHESVCLHLIEKGANVNAKDNRGRTALTLAKSSHLQSILQKSVPRS